MSLEEKNKHFNEKKRQSMLSEVEEKIPEIQSLIEEEKAGIDIIRKATVEHIKLLEVLKSEVLGAVGGMTEIKKAIQKRVYEELIKLAYETESFESFEKANARLKQFTKNSETNDLNVEMFESETDQKNMEKEFAEKVERKATEEIIMAVDKANLGAGSFSALEKAINKFSGRESIGHKNSAEVKEFVAETLVTESKKLTGGDEVEVRAKKIMIARLLVKLR